MHNLFLVYLRLSISTCFGRLWANHQEKQLCFATLGTCYSVWMTVWYAAAYAPAYQTVATQSNKYQVSQKHSSFSWWWAHSHPKHVEINKYVKNKLCTKLALFTRLYRDARSLKLKKTYNSHDRGYCCLLGKVQNKQYQRMPRQTLRHLSSKRET